MFAIDLLLIYSPEEGLKKRDLLFLSEEETSCVCSARRSVTPIKGNGVGVVRAAKDATLQGRSAFFAPHAVWRTVPH